THSEVVLERTKMRVSAVLAGFRYGTPRTNQLAGPARIFVDSESTGLVPYCRAVPVERASLPDRGSSRRRFQARGFCGHSDLSQDHQKEPGCKSHGTQGTLD